MAKKAESRKPYPLSHGWGHIAPELITDGLEPGRSQQLATVILAAIEGGILMARVHQDVAILDTIAKEMMALVQRATAEQPPAI